MDGQRCKRCTNKKMRKQGEEAEGLGAEREKEREDQLRLRCCNL